MYSLFDICKIKKDFMSLVYTYSYSLLPTLIWFTTTSILYLLIPPPRSLSLLGKGFSIFFISFSLTILFWKLMLTYLALRFSLKISFYRIIYFMILYLCWFLPYSLILYNLKIFKVPFI